MSCAKPKRTNSCGTTWNGWSLGLLYKGRAVNKIGCEKSSKWQLQRTTKRTSRLDSNKSETKKKALRRHRSKNLFFRFFEDENELLQNHRSHKKVVCYIRWIKVGSQMSGKPTVTKDSKDFLEYCGNIHLHSLIHTRQFRTTFFARPQYHWWKVWYLPVSSKFFRLEQYPMVLFKFFKGKLMQIQKSNGIFVLI